MGMTVGWWHTHAHDTPPHTRTSSRRLGDYVGGKGKVEAVVRTEVVAGVVEGALGVLGGVLDELGKALVLFHAAQVRLQRCSRREPTAHTRT